MKISREDIIREALDQFTHQDYDRVTLNTIAHALEVTKGAIYHYFTSKDALFHDTVTYLMDTLEHTTIDTIDMTKPIREQLQPFFLLGSIAQGYALMFGIDVFADYKNFISLVFSAIKKFPDIEHRLSDLYRTMRIVFTSLIQAAQERGEVRKEIDAEAIAFEIIAFIEGGLLVSSLEPDLAKMSDDLGIRVFTHLWERIASPVKE